MSEKSGGQSWQTSTSSNPPPSIFPEEPNVNDDSQLDNQGVAPERRGSHGGHNGVFTEAVRPAATSQDELQYRRHKPRGSGGFLLQSTSPTFTQPRSPRSPEADVSQNVKGKRRAEDGDLHIAKRASARHRHLKKASVGSSPLSTHVQAASVQDDDKITKANTRNSIHSTTGQSARSGATSNGTSTGSPSMVDEGSPLKGRGAIGLDTDPAQIVNLALNLSESRRRHFSSGGLHAPWESAGGRRVLSSGQPLPGLYPGMGGGSLRQHMQEQRHVSRNISPRSSKALTRKGVGVPSPQQDTNETRSYTSVSDFETSVNSESEPDISDATLARAEKARVALELSFEYRRLLQYLPTLPIPSKGRLNSSRGEMRPLPYPADGLGRVYNPLQYIRNRKVRFREKRPMDTEGAGWNDVESVRAWVDVVADEREDGISRVDRRYPLPPFEKPNRKPSHYDDDQHGNGYIHSIDPPVKKIPRPSKDWEFAPWDLLADAYWLHQDDNVEHIEDTQGMRFVTRNMSMSENRPRTSKESTRKSAQPRHNFVRHINSSPERLRASFESLRSESKQRGRQRKDDHEPRSPISDGDNPLTKKGRWSKKFMRYRDSSSSSESYSGTRRKHRRGGRDNLGSRDDFDNAALEKQMMEIMAREAKDINMVTDGKDERHFNEMPINAQGVREPAGQSITSPASKLRPSGPQRMKTDFPAIEQHKQTPPRSSLDEQRLYHHQMSSDDLGSTAPSSPTAPGFIPSIAINLSPPASPQSAAASPKKLLPTRLSSFRRDRSQSINGRANNDADAPVETSTSADNSRQTINNSQFGNALKSEHSIATSNGLLSPSKLENGIKPRTLEGKQIRNMKSLVTSDSRLRGLLRGGRIAELVSNEVSRVGDAIWRRDGNDRVSQLNPTASGYTTDESEFDDGGASGLDDSPRDNMSRVPTNSETGGKLSRTSTNSEKPRYHMSNLPSFRSPFGKDELSLKFANGIPNDDHVARQQLAQRERGRSSRFDRLAPPKIDMTGVSPSSSAVNTPERSQSRVTYDESSRQSSGSRSGRRVRSADRRLNAMLGVPGHVTTGPTPTGLSSLKVGRQGSEERPGLQGKRHWSISDRGISAVLGTITKRDIARVRALLLSSGVKANEIIRRAEEVPDKPKAFFRDLDDVLTGPAPRVTRAQEHVFAARTLINLIDRTTQQLRDSAEQFSHGTVEKLHEEIKSMDDHVNHKLTPMVREAGDDADTFNTELTTTHTLAIKRLNDSVDGILRRRRRRLRWIRRVGWAVLEWTLLGAMWMVWFIVMIIQLVRGVIGGFIGIVRWFFWL